MRTRHGQVLRKPVAASLRAALVVLLALAWFWSAPSSFIGPWRRGGSRNGRHSRASADAARPASPQSTAVLLDALASMRERLEKDFADHASPTSNSALLCSSCGHYISELRFNEGTSRHLNREGCVCHIGHFSRAQGAVPTGREFPENAWFPGWMWRMATCPACGQHVGWLFEKKTSEKTSAPFCGLMWNRLQQADSHLD